MILRPARPEDAPAMAALLNEIIAIGGTTAHQNAVSAPQIDTWYITGAKVICCHIATSTDGILLGFQAVDTNAALPEGWGDIGSFVALTARGTGAAKALFVQTTAAARAKGIQTLNATIRADNTLGLAYYGRMGFVDYTQDADFCHNDGTRVGRISKRYDIA